MGEPAVFEFAFPDGKAAYCLHWASPCFQIPAIGKWVAETTSARESLTLDSWEAWFPVEYYDESRGLVAMERTDVTPGVDLGRTHGANHHYRLTAAAGAFAFTCHSRDLRAMTRDVQWKHVTSCASVEDLLHESVSQVRTLRRTVRGMRRQDGLRIDEWTVRCPSISALTDWIRQCEQRAEAHARDIPATTTLASCVVPAGE